MANALDRSNKERLLKIATGASVLVAIILVIIKGLAWLKTGSVAMLGSLLDSILDAGAAGLNMYFVRKALRPADETHRFGHGKAEPIGGLGEADKHFLDDIFGRIHITGQHNGQLEKMSVIFIIDSPQGRATAPLEFPDKQLIFHYPITHQKQDFYI